MWSSEAFTHASAKRATSGVFLLSILLEEQLCNSRDVITAVHPCVATARIHGLVLDSSVLEVLLELE